MTVQIVEFEGQKIAMLPLADFERLAELAEEKEDARLADAGEQRRLAGEEYLPASMVNRILDGENALKIWREYRGMSVADLASRANCSYSMLSKIEHGSRTGTIAVWQALANALNVTTEDILPVD